MTTNITDKLLNGKTTSVGVIGILVILGLNSLGLGGGERPATKEDVNLLVEKVVERQSLMIANQRDLATELRSLSDNAKEMAIILRDMKK